MAVCGLGLRDRLVWPLAVKTFQPSIQGPACAATLVRMRSKSASVCSRPGCVKRCAVAVSADVLPEAAPAAGVPVLLAEAVAMVPSLPASPPPPQPDTSTAPSPYMNCRRAALSTPPSTCSSVPGTPNAALAWFIAPASLVVVVKAGRNVQEPCHTPYQGRVTFFAIMLDGICRSVFTKGQFR